MFLRQLEYLIAVIEEDHFGRAAEKCHVKQPSLSNGIKQLESELGITLFKRGRAKGCMVSLKREKKYRSGPV